MNLGSQLAAHFRQRGDNVSSFLLRSLKLPLVDKSRSASSRLSTSDCSTPTAVRQAFAWLSPMLALHKGFGRAPMWGLTLVEGICIITALKYT